MPAAPGTVSWLTLSTSMSSSTGLNGFRKTASAPARRRSSLSMSPPVSKITWGERGERLSSRQNVSPSFPGRLTSRITTSGPKEARDLRSSLGGVRFLDVELVGRERRSEEQRRPASSSTTRTRSRAGSRAATSVIGVGFCERLEAAMRSALARSARSTPPAPKPRNAPTRSPTSTETTSHSRTPTRTHVPQLGMSLRLLSLSRTHVEHTVSRSEPPCSQYALQIRRPCENPSIEGHERAGSAVKASSSRTRGRRRPSPRACGTRSRARGTSSRSRARARVAPAAAP